jgi:hypothetical protein
LERKSYSIFYTFLEDLKKDKTKFFNFFRMNRVTFQKLLTLVQDKLKHVDTDMREFITLAEQLAVTFKYV